MKRIYDEEFYEYVPARMDRWRRSAYLMCQDWHVADDIVAVAVGRLYEHWPRARQADNIDAYAQRILTRSWLNEARRPWRRERPHEELPEPETVEAATQTAVDRESLAALHADPAAGPVLTEPELIDIVTDIAARIGG